MAQQLPRLLTAEQLELGGLEIRTSINLDWQLKAQQVVREYGPADTEGAMVSIEPGTGLGTCKETDCFYEERQHLYSDGCRTPELITTPEEIFRHHTMSGPMSDADIHIPRDKGNDNLFVWGGEWRRATTRRRPLGTKEGER